MISSILFHWCMQCTMASVVQLTPTVCIIHLCMHGTKLIEESEKSRQSPGVEPRTPLACMSCQCSATEPQQPDNHQPPQSSMYTAQVVLNVSVVHPAFSTTCAVYIEDCGGWWLSGCCGSVAEHWQLMQARGVLGSTPGACWPFSFSSICTS